MKHSKQLYKNTLSLQELLLLVFIVVFHLWPAYAVLKIGTLPGLNLQRFCLILLITLWIYNLLSSPWYLFHLFRQVSKHRYLVLGLTIYFLWKYLSTIYSDNLIKSLYAATNEFVPFFLLFLVGITVWYDSRQVERAVFVLVISSLLVSLLGIYENFVQHNIFENFVPITSEYTEFALGSKVRGEYRIQSTFSHPLVLAQYLTFTIPIAFTMAISSRALFYQVLGIIVLFFSGLALFLTGSRAAIGILVFLGILVVIWRVWMIIKSPKASGYLLTSIATMFLPIVIAIAASSVFIILAKVQGGSLEEISSTTGRLTQLETGIPLVMAQPIFGYGAGNAVTTLDFGHYTSLPTIDNYYLSIALDSGLPALALFIFILGYALILSLQTSYLGVPLASGFIFSLLGFILFASILSLTVVYPIIFLSFAVLIVLKEEPAISASM